MHMFSYIHIHLLQDIGFLRWPGLYITEPRMVAEILIDLQFDVDENLRTEVSNLIPIPRF